MKLNILDRIYVPTILPSENTFMEFNLKRSIIQKVTLTPEDVAMYNITEDEANNRTTWDISKDQDCPLDVDFTQQELDYLKRACEMLADKPAPDNLWLTVEKIYSAMN